MLTLYNTLTKTLEQFVPVAPPHVSLYTCGMTVYDYAHIGHGRKYVGDDILRRTLTRFGYTVNHVQNVTDVGHLSSDADSGEDKLEKGAAKFGKTVWEVAEFFTNHFYDSMAKLNILTPTVICKATEHIPEQISLVQALIAGGHAYETEEAVYFDVTSFAQYGKLFGQSIEDKKTAVRDDVQTGIHKRHPADFALWFKRVGRFANHTMHWDSPWGDGFPGWHIECSAMSLRYLTSVFAHKVFDKAGAQTIDIHTGGIEHTAVHHPNEIAQSEAATGVPFVKYWVHYGHLMVDGVKMSKSLGNIYTIEDVIGKGYEALALRYFYFSANYRKPLNFTWEALTASQNALTELRKQVAAVISHKNSGERVQLSEEKLAKVDEYRTAFDKALADDLNTAQALAIVWEVVKSNIPPSDKYDLIIDFDEVLGLGLRSVSEPTLANEIPQAVKELIKRRDELRMIKHFEEADNVREQIVQAGYDVSDSSTGTMVKKRLA